MTSIFTSHLVFPHPNCFPYRVYQLPPATGNHNTTVFPLRQAFRQAQKAPRDPAYLLCFGYQHLRRVLPKLPTATYRYPRIPVAFHDSASWGTTFMLISHVVRLSNMFFNTICVSLLRWLAGSMETIGMERQMIRLFSSPLAGIVLREHGSGCNQRLKRLPKSPVRKHTILTRGQTCLSRFFIEKRWISFEGSCWWCPYL